MPKMEEITRIAVQVRTPLALAGFTCALFFLLLSKIIIPRLPQLTQAQGAGVLRLAIRSFFILSLVATCLGFLGWVFPHPPQRTAAWPEAFEKLNENVISTHEFSLLRATGTTFSIGSKDQCIIFQFGDLKKERGTLLQEIFVRGKGRGLWLLPNKQLLLTLEIRVNDGWYNYDIQSGKTSVLVPIRPNVLFQLITESAQIDFKILDTRAESLRMQIQVSPPPKSPFPPTRIPPGSVLLE